MKFRIITDEGDGYILQKKRGPFWVLADWFYQGRDGPKVPNRYGSLKDARLKANSIVSETREKKVAIIEVFNIY